MELPLKTNDSLAQYLLISYSGIYTKVDPTKFNIKSIIDKLLDNNKLKKNFLQSNMYPYGLSSFVLADNSGCSHSILMFPINTVNSYTGLV